MEEMDPRVWVRLYPAYPGPSLYLLFLLLLIHHEVNSSLAPHTLVQSSPPVLRLSLLGNDHRGDNRLKHWP